MHTDLEQKATKETKKRGKGNEQGSLGIKAMCDREPVENLEDKRFGVHAPSFLAPSACNHMRILFTAALCLLATVALGADKIQQIIDQGPVTKEALAVLTTNDVPAKWRTRMEQKDSAKGSIKSFYRGREKILQVIWLNQGSGSKSNLFSATVYHGTRAVVSIASLSTNGTSIMQTKDSVPDHLVMTTIADDGKVSVFIKDEKDYFEYITVAGHNTRLLDDLEYTRERVHWEQVGRPLADEVIGFLKPFKDKADQYNQSRTNR